MNSPKRILTGLTVASVLSLAAYAQTSAKESGSSLKTVSCPPDCGFSVTSRDEKELIESIKLHAKTHHHLDLNDDQVKGMIKEKMASKN